MEKRGKTIEFGDHPFIPTIKSDRPNQKLTTIDFRPLIKKSFIQIDQR
jgi:hypothetical protein